MGAYLNFNVASWRHGRRVTIPLIGGVGFDNLVVSEPWLDRILPVLLERRPGAFVDVGVNIGQTLLKVKTLAPETDYVGFEPNPACFSYTQTLVTVNRFERCTLMPAGLSNETRVVPLFGTSLTDVSGSVVAGFRPAWRSPQLMHVAVFRGDELLESLGAPDVGTLKVDVEGGELEVLQGLRSTIGRNRPYIVCEILPLFSSTSEMGRFRLARQRDLISAMREAGYGMYRILGNASAEPLSEIECHSDMSLTNYLFAPLEECEYIDHTLADASRREVAS